MHMYNEQESKARIQGIVRLMKEKGVIVSNVPTTTVGIVDLNIVEKASEDILNHITTMMEKVSQENYDFSHLDSIHALLENLNEGERLALARAYRKVFFGGMAQRFHYQDLLRQSVNLTYEDMEQIMGVNPDTVYDFSNNVSLGGADEINACMDALDKLYVHIYDKLQHLKDME